MKSARRTAFIERKNKTAKTGFPFFRILIPIAIILAVLLFLKASTKVWNGQDKTAIAFREGNGDVGVTVLDPGLSEVTTLIIPGDTETDVARNYGTMRIKNLWQLGINEKIGGVLLPETVTQDFLFPSFLWCDESASCLSTGNLSGIIHFVFVPGLTNITFGDRLSMGIFAAKIQDFGRSIINLGKSDFLKKEILTDGQSGYVLSGPISQRLTSYFSDDSFGDGNLRVNIEDATGSPGVSDTVGQILQVLGGKVVSVDKKTVAEDSDCTAYGDNPKVMKKIFELFGCKDGGRGSSNFDLDIHLGAAFAKRF